MLTKPGSAKPGSTRPTSRRWSRISAFATCGSLLLLPRPSFGEASLFRGSDSDYEANPIPDFAIELRFGPYLPNVDDKVNGSPFRDTFGDDNRYLIGVEFDWQALRLGKIASFGPGAGWGFTTMSADALLANRTGRAAQSTSLTLMPMYLVGVLRVDALAVSHIAPLVGYAKAGLGNALWWSSSGDDVSEVNGVSAEGTSFGYQWALGAMLLLDYFDLETAASMRSATEVANSYAFFEWYSSSLDGFGAADQLQAGTQTWMAGLAVEF